MEVFKQHILQESKITTWEHWKLLRYNDVIMRAMASQITSLTIVYSTVYSGADQRKHQSSASLAFVRGIHRWPVNSPHKGPVTRKTFPFDDVFMYGLFFVCLIAYYFNTCISSRRNRLRIGTREFSTIIHLVWRLHTNHSLPYVANMSLYHYLQGPCGPVK